MPWSGSAPNQTFTRNNGTHSGDATWAQDEASAVGITAERHDIHDEDISDGLNATLKRDGRPQSQKRCRAMLKGTLLSSRKIGKAVDCAVLS